MNTFNTLALIAHVLIAASIIGLVMLQKGKGADAGQGAGGVGAGHRRGGEQKVKKKLGEETLPSLSREEGEYY